MESDVPFRMRLEELMPQTGGHGRGLGDGAEDMAQLEKR